MFCRNLTGWLGLVLVLVVLTGCNKDELTDAIGKGMDSVGDATDKVKDATQQATETIKEKANMAGSMELAVGGPVAVGRCYVSLVTPMSGEPSVFQITSYRDESDESFPSVFFRGQAPGASLSELSGQTVTGSLYLQNKEDGPVWHTPIGTQVEVFVATVKDGEVVGQFVGGSITETQSGQSVDVTGKFNGPTL